MTTRFFLLLCLLNSLLLGINACGIRKAQTSSSTTQQTPISNQAPSNPVTPPNNNSSNTSTTPTKPTDVVMRPTTPPPIISTPKTEIKPIEVKTPIANDISQQKDIALFLPFMKQNYYEGMNADSLPEKSKMALEFYQGFLLGIEQLKQQGINLNVQVFDTENNPNKTNRILADSTAMQNIDLIVGPIHNSELKETAAYAKKQKIYNVSPLSPATQNTKENPYYIIANPPIETHISAIYDYINRNYSNKRIISISGNKPSETNLAALLGKSNSSSSFESSSTPVHPLAYNTGITPISDIEAQMNAEEKNIFIVTNFSDEALIIDLANKLNTLRNRYQIALFGMPNWIELPNLPLDILANIDFHYTTPYFEMPSIENEQFKQSFYGKYRCYPTEYASKGYDIIKYFGTMQNLYGRQIGNALQDKQGLFTNFKFRTVTLPNNKAAISHIENKYINIIRFRKDYVLEKINY